ncbi:helix-turn-helix domain-containing protein [Halopiger xanaduensis]|uniref:Bacterio-opsin activator HTH domain protein n=1 Tax=Halopiger xanaduensis (strain DSM 18323 / JCM 14033 / SH-6) TaxID=797210 RepID=F8D647_HALXS|nr:helix-turn-helix domain-containing protein [Halopiger xanaduensis]AEH38910.1 Bacterio-opsin activator HTH domain protein [Halopiger xanaduensis SH-6]
MALIVEFELRTPVLREAARAARELRLGEVYGNESGEPKLLFWATVDDGDAFEAALDEDPSVRRYTALETASDRRLYSVALTDDAASRLASPVAAEHDVAILEIVVTDETVVRARVLSRDALQAYREQCLGRDVGFKLRRLYLEEEPDTDTDTDLDLDGDRYGVTEPQREALRTAHSAGYFTVPRETTLSELAAEFDISDQALSARLRRGQANLLENTLADDT